jgi:hypothetical protein
MKRLVVKVDLVVQEYNKKVKNTPSNEGVFFYFVVLRAYLRFGASNGIKLAFFI